MGRFLVTTVALEKQKVLNILSICLYYCLKLSRMQIASFPPRIALLSVARLALPYFSTFPHEVHDFRKEFTLPKRQF